MSKGGPTAQNTSFVLIYFLVRVITIQIVFLLICYVPIIGCTILNGKGLISMKYEKKTRKISIKIHVMSKPCLLNLVS